MVKEFSGKWFKDPRGSLSSLRVSLPVLTMVVVTFKFSNPSTSGLGVEVLMVTLGPPGAAGAAEVATAEAIMAMREARRKEENIVVRVAKAVEETIPMKP